ncbi:MAG: ribosome-associated translation inhibitor RaiA [Candidatus Latescibacteria bacterium]|nr:ribosome-associated translation inhibitor RaiA [Candidatus Latescibacterota bacterium]
MTKAYDFDVQVTCRHETCDSPLRESIVEQIMKLSKFHPHILDSNVIINRQNSSVKVEISVRVPGLTITAVNEDYNQAKALDAAIEKAKIQIKKLKSKIADHRVQPPLPVVEAEIAEDSEFME